MAIIVLASAKGSPGVTTTALALATQWPIATGRRALVFDADESGGDTAAGILRGAVPPGAGVLPLATARNKDLQEAVASASVSLVRGEEVRLVPGIPDADRSGALPIAWDVLASGLNQRAALASATPDDCIPPARACDVFVDAGRISTAAASKPWFISANLTLLVLLPTLPAVRAAERLLTGWPGTRIPLRAVVVDQPSPYTPRQTADALRLPLLGAVAHEPTRAAVFSAGAPAVRHHDRSSFQGDIARLATAVAHSVLSEPGNG